VVLFSNHPEKNALCQRKKGIKVKVTRTQTCGIMGRAQQHRRRSAVHGQDNQALGSKSTVHLQSGD